MRFIKLIFFLVIFQLNAQQGGMWIPSLLEGMNEEEMQSLGSKLSAIDIYNVNKSSLKDAIGHFNGGCTSEVISKKGLLLTNHHCGYSQIQSHSSLENDYITNGFWANSFEEEIPNEGLFVEFIVSIEDVTESMLQGITDEMTPKEKQSQIDKNRNAFEKTIDKEEWQGFKIRPFYK
ncbi:MAG: S46 family peptidase, partial [Bacteroidota bacterium]